MPDILLLSSKRGKRYTTGIKILLGILCGAVFSLLFQMVHFFYLNAAGGGGYAGGCFTEEKELKHDCGICVGPYAGIIIFPRVGWILSVAALGALPGMWIFEAG
ncbi:MAG: hypothetical protein HFG38_11625 [Eubacterium sp.]|nr:hypothetical protein [Eubacterium sp.]